MAKKKTTKKKAPRKPKPKEVKCKGKKGCGYSFIVGSEDDKRKKEWNIYSPMPDKDGNITITFMATWDCPQCGKNITGSSGKTKGEMTGKSKKERIEDQLAENLEFEVKTFATSIGVDEVNLTKILNMMIKKGSAKGIIKDGKFIPA
ncbi:MAG: hypothetical protein ACXAD7_14205 [Candidatus Kariarchaeaceae archaeon]|jgi:hypothetical protein